MATVSTASADAMINRFLDAIVNPILLLLFAVAFLVFLYGMFNMIRNSDNTTELETGKRNILYGFIGMLIMVLAWSIVAVVKGTFGIK